MLQCVKHAVQDPELLQLHGGSIAAELEEDAALHDTMQRQLDLVVAELEAEAGKPSLRRAAAPHARSGSRIDGRPSSSASASSGPEHVEPLALAVQVPAQEARAMAAGALASRTPPADWLESQMRLNHFPQIQSGPTSGHVYVPDRVQPVGQLSQSTWLLHAASTAGVKPSGHLSARRI